jgi:hypothetical protein
LLQVPGAASQQAADEPWFTFPLEPSLFTPGSSYALQLDLYCRGSSSGGSSSGGSSSGGSSSPTLQSAVFLRAAHCGGSGSGAGQDGAAAAAAAAAAALQPWQSRLAGRLQQLMQRVASSFTAMQAQQPAPASAGVELRGPAAAAAAGGRLRQLAETADTVPVILYPSVAGQVVVVDGYSGLARPLNGTEDVPICPADGDAGSEADAAAAGASACLRDPVVRTADDQIRIAMLLAGGAAIPEGVLPIAAFVLGGNATLTSVTRIGSDSLEAIVKLAPDESPVTGGCCPASGKASGVAAKLTCVLGCMPVRPPPPSPLRTAPTAAACCLPHCRASPHPALPTLPSTFLSAPPCPAPAALAGPAVVVPEGALQSYGIANAASNVLTVERDLTPPVVSCSCACCR